jgi:hypothetical protein
MGRKGCGPLWGSGVRCLWDSREEQTESELVLSERSVAIARNRNGGQGAQWVMAGKISLCHWSSDAPPAEKRAKRRERPPAEVMNGNAEAN